MIFFQKKHTFYVIGIVCAALVLIGGQWFNVHPWILRLTATVFLGSIALTTITALTSLSGLFAILLIPFGAALPLGILGSIAYFAGVPLTQIGIAGVVVGTACIGIALSHVRPNCRISFNDVLGGNLFQSVGFLISLACACATLITSQTTDAVLGPWHVVHSSFFIWYALATLFLLWSCMTCQNRSHLLFLCLYGVLSASVALIVFPLGFGFDPFIHEAAQSHIARFGSLQPKNLYYIGHYALVVVFSKLFIADISMVNRALVPIGSMLTLVPLSIAAFKKPLLTLLLFILPYPFLIVSTPWGFAYGITAVIVLSSNKKLFCSLASVFALLVHPLAGIPAILYVALVRLLSYLQPQSRARNLIGGVVWFLIAISAIPAAFIINSLTSSQLAVSFSMPHFTLPTLLSFPTRFSAVLDPVYVFSTNLFLILAFAAIPGFVLLWRNGGTDRRHALGGILSFTSTLISAFFLTHVLTFPSLISYERNDYGIRLVSLAFVFLIPSLAASIRIAVQRLTSSMTPNILRLAGAFAICCGLLASLYLSYPRNDAFQAFHGYNPSAADSEAIHWIHADAGDKRFVLLSNQVVSSILIHTYGFGGDSFQYSLPTSSPLYGIYRDLLISPTQTTLAKVQTLYPNVRIYVAINAYEPRFPLIVAEMKKLIPRWTSFRNDTVLVFAIE